jgi:hypothetical protein
LTILAKHLEKRQQVKVWLRWKQNFFRTDKKYVFLFCLVRK